MNAMFMLVFRMFAKNLRLAVANRLFLVNVLGSIMYINFMITIISIEIYIIPPDFNPHVVLHLVFTREIPAIATKTTTANIINPVE